MYILSIRSIGTLYNETNFAERTKIEGFSIIVLIIRCTYIKEREREVFPLIS